jgi:hypothetical protein
MMVALKEHWPNPQAVAKQFEVSWTTPAPFDRQRLKAGIGSTCCFSPAVAGEPFLLLSTVAGLPQMKCDRIVNVASGCGGYRMLAPVIVEHLTQLCVLYVLVHFFLQDARVLRATIIQNHATATANIKELSAGFKAFWEQTPGGDDITERFREFQVRGMAITVAC